MNIIIDNVNIDKILIKKKINIYKLYYNHSLYYKILGIPIKIKYKYITVHNNLYYIFFDENENNNLVRLNNYMSNIINNFLFIRNNITTKFIICNNYNKQKIKYAENNMNNQNNNFIYININKIKYIKNNNIPIINILQ
jgi:hypothetical protein